MDEKPAKIWVIFIIVLAVGLYYVLYQGLYNMLTIDGGGGIGISVAIVPIIFGVLTLLVAFMVYGGNGKTFLTILSVLAILGNLISLWYSPRCRASSKTIWISLSKSYWDRR